MAMGVKSCLHNEGSHDRKHKWKRCRKALCNGKSKPNMMDYDLMKMKIQLHIWKYAKQSKAKVASSTINLNNRVEMVKWHVWRLLMSVINLTNYKDTIV
jgi:hypothetical protein